MEIKKGGLKVQLTVMKNKMFAGVFHIESLLSDNASYFIIKSNKINQ